MITIIRDNQGNIKTYSQSPLESYNVALDETFETMEIGLVQYAERFKLSAPAITGLLYASPGESVDVIVSTNLKVHTVDVNVNGVIETVQIEDGVGVISLALDTPGLFILQPADRREYCAAGTGNLTVEILPNE